MFSTAINSRMESLCNVPDKKESTADKLERQFQELEKRADKYFDDLDEVEEMCQQAKEDVKRFELKAEAEKEIVKRDGLIQAKLYSSIKEMSEKLKRMEVKDQTRPAEEKMPTIPEEAKNALRYTVTGRLCRYVKIGCVLVFDAVAAYGLFKLTQPYFF